MLFGNSVVVGKSNDLSDLERKVFPELLYEFYCGERIGTVAIGDELKVLRKKRVAEEMTQFADELECYSIMERQAAFMMNQT